MVKMMKIRSVNQTNTLFVQKICFDEGVTSLTAHIPGGIDDLVKGLAGRCGCGLARI